jgi:hypothetical protein
MPANVFRYWLGILTEHFPDHQALKVLGMSWYPGRKRTDHRHRLTVTMALSSTLRVSFSDAAVGTGRLYVIVQKSHPLGVATFWIEPRIELRQHYHGFNPTELAEIITLLGSYEAVIREAWQRYADDARAFQRESLAILEKGAGVPQAQDWERELVRQAVENRFAEGHRGAVLAELGRMRGDWLAAMGTAGMDTEELVRLVVRTQLDAVEQSAGDPAFLTEEHYMQSASGLTDEDRLYVLDQIIKDRQLMGKDVTSLIKMLDVGTTRLDALSALERKGGEAVKAIPRLLEMLRESDQLECCRVLRTLAGIGPAAQGAVSAVVELANDPDYLMRLWARAALKAIAPERASELELGK